MSPKSVGADPYRLLFACLRDPVLLPSVTEAEWNDLMPLARALGLFARLAALAAENDSIAAMPPRIAGHLTAVLRYAEFRRRRILWEIDRLEHVLAELRVPVVVLKGSAYLLAGLEVGKGRIFGDVDLLVPAGQVPKVEATLRKAGWTSADLSHHDERYYREWMHEIPALRHPTRMVEVDVHHSIAPPISRFAVDVTPFFEAASALPGQRFLLPAPVDLVLHSAVHLLSGGEFENGLRDLADIEGMLREFTARDSGFWFRLLERATQLGLERLLHDALRHCQHIFGLPIPAEVSTALAAARPGFAGRWIMDRLWESALLPRQPAAPGACSAMARGILWLRSHWLKMPLRILLYHGFKKLAQRPGAEP